jgi:hypothetical protein
MSFSSALARRGETMAAVDKSGVTDPRNEASDKRRIHILPLVMRMRSNIDQVFSRYVGPISSELGAEEFDRWREEGQVGPRGLHRYITRLARHISDDTQRREFMRFASHCIQVSGIAKG